MPLNIRHAEEDEAPLLDGDEQFFGVKMRGHPAGLPPGWVASAINCRFREGIAEPRLGTVKPPWLNQLAGTAMSAWESGQARGRYVDAARRQWTLLGVNGGVRAILPHNAPRTVPLPAGVTLTGGEQFLQFGSVVLLLRHTNGDTLQMTDLNTGFEAVPAPLVVGGGISAIPAAKRGCVVADRVWLVTNTDEIWASDLLDHTSYHPLNQFTAEDGAMEVVTLTPVGQTRIAVLLKKAVGVLEGIFSPDGAAGILAQCQYRSVTTRYGCVAADSAVDLGTDLAWLCEEGVATLALTVEGEMQSGQGPNRPPMFSDDLLPLIKRIRWDYAAGAQAEFWDGRLYMAVPLDRAEVLGPNLSGGDAFYDSGVSYTVPVQAGATYRFVKGAEQSLPVALYNGTQELTVSSDFVAQEGFVYLNGGSGDIVTASVRRLYKGINNAVLVYDFKALQPGWQGHDEADGILMPQFWFRRDYNGRERLFSLGADGWGTLHEEGFEDQLGQPYADVQITALPANGNTLTVNGGTVVTADSSTSDNTAPNFWGCFALPVTLQNIWTNLVTLIGGFYTGSSSQWSAPFTAALKLTDGVRFISTNGRRPRVVITGSWASVSTYQWQAVRTELLSRGYATPARIERKSALKLQALVETWNPSYSISLKSEGVNEETTFVSSSVRSRTRYDRPFTRAAWLASNVNNDFATPYRGDYSLTLGTPFKLGEGLGIGLHQAAEHCVKVGGRARAHQVRVINTSGRLRLTALGYEGRRRERGHGIKV